MNNYFIFLILVIINISLLKIIINNSEKFQVSNINKDTEIIETNLKKQDEYRLNKFKDDSSLFSQFCKKIKYFNDNYDSSSRLNTYNKFAKFNTIKNNKEKNDKLLNEIFKLQEKIYLNPNDIVYFKKYEQKMNNKTIQYINVLDKIISNLKNNLSSDIILNIK